MPGSAGIPLSGLPPGGRYLLDNGGEDRRQFAALDQIHNAGVIEYLTGWALDQYITTLSTAFFYKWPCNPGRLMVRLRNAVLDYPFKPKSPVGGWKSSDGVH